MKRVFSLVLAAIMVFGLFGCGKANKEVKEVQLGGVLKNDMLELTFTEFGVAEEGVSIDEEGEHFCKPIPFPYQLTGNEMMDNLTLTLSQETYVRPTEGTVVVYMEYVLKNTSEQIAKIYSCPVIHYNNTDSYVLDGVSKLAMADYFNGMNDGVYFAQSGDSWQARFNLYSAGSETVCRGVARVPAEVMSNTSAPLTVTFTLPRADETTDTYTVTIR